MKTAMLRRSLIVALLSGLIAVLGLTPIGLIPLGFINITVLCVPVVVGTLLLGLKSGLVLGATFGLVSFISLLIKPSALAGALMSRSPTLATLMCFAPRLLVPVVALFFSRVKHAARMPLASALGSLTNTVFYLGIMLVGYIITGLDAAAVLGLIIGTGAIAGGLEALTCALIAPPVVRAIQKTKLIPKEES